MPAIAKPLAMLLGLSALAMLCMRHVFAIDEGVVIDEAIAVKIKDSKCLTRACKGAHSERGDHCRWTQKDGLKGTCLLCDGNEHAPLCGVAANQECQVGGLFGAPSIYCGQMALGLCRKDPASPTGASCIKDSSTAKACRLTTCEGAKSQEVEDPIGP